MSALPSVVTAPDQRSAAGPRVRQRALRADRAGRRELRIAKGLRRRDPRALDEAYREFGGTTFGYLLRALGDRAHAEDIQQVVFTEVWQRGPDYDPKRASLLTWILTIARSRAIDHLRRRVPEPRDPERTTAAIDARRHDTTLDDLLGEWRVAHLLGRLPADEAEVLRGRFLDDRTQAEIAEASGMPLGTVKLRMVQGLARLRELVEAEEAMA